MKLRAIFWILSLLFAILTTLLITIWNVDSIFTGVAITLNIIFALGFGLANIITED